MRSGELSLSLADCSTQEVLYLAWAGGADPDGEAMGKLSPKAVIVEELCPCPSRPCVLTGQHSVAGSGGMGTGRLPLKTGEQES